MPRIAGVDLPRDKRVEIGLTYIHGIGRSRSNEILGGTGVEPDMRVKDLNENDIARLRQFIDRNYEVEGDLRRRVGQNIQRLKEIGAYRGRAPGRTPAPEKGHAKQWPVAAGPGSRSR